VPRDGDELNTKRSELSLALLSTCTVPVRSMKPRGTCVFEIFYDRETAPSSRRRRQK
jgi:hypothetical protein